MEIPVSLDSLTRALRREFPTLSPLAPLRLLGSGFGSLVVETPGGIVFRIARTPEAGAQYAREARLLLAIEDFPLAIPRPEWLLSLADEFPYGLVGYRKLPGQPPEPQRQTPPEREMLAVQIGEILLALQRIPLENLPLPAGRPNHRAVWQKLRAAVLPTLRDALRPGEYQKVAAWWEAFLSDDLVLDYIPVFQHGDLWFGNLLVEQNRVVGLVDFQEAGPGDPAQDFVPQLYLGERFLRQVMEAFQRAGGTFDPGFEHRLSARWAVREFGGLAYSIKYDDREELADSIEKIRKGPILSPFGLDGWG